jgi:hypothetical protein
MSTEALRTEIKRLDRQVDWFGCVAGNRARWKRYHALSTELSERETNAVPACDACGACQWRISPNEAIHCQLCQTTPTRECRNEIRRIWARINPERAGADDR